MPTTEFGLDLRYAPSSNIGIDFSFNPDFATVEADVEQVNLTRYELSYPEKRPFFLEGTESYRTRIVQFYSRRIGDMQWGAKVNGKVGKWRVNGLASQTDSETVTSSAGPGALYSAFRLSREIGGASNVGMIGANRTFDGTSEGSVGLVGTLFFSDYLGMTSQVIRSYGAHDEGAWTYFFRPFLRLPDRSFPRPLHPRRGERPGEHEPGRLHSGRRPARGGLQRAEAVLDQPESGLQDLTGSINYNQFWSQSGRLRSWKISNRVGLNFLKRWTLDVSNGEEFKAEEPGLFEKHFRNSLNQAKLTFDTRTGTSVSAYYGRGLNFDSDLDQFGGVVDWTITDALTATYDLKRVWFDPDPHDRSSWVHFVRATYYLNKDMFFKAFYQTRYDVTGSLSSPMFDLERETIQLLYVWRFFPPFGSLQLAYQEGPAQFDDELVNYRTLFTKLSWVF